MSLPTYPPGQMHPISNTSGPQLSPLALAFREFIWMETGNASTPSLEAAGRKIDIEINRLIEEKTRHFQTVVAI